jgi:gluconate 5-dehydrogenase
LGQNLTGFTAVITGASGGMGYEMAKALLSRGASVGVTSRAGAKLDKAFEELSKDGADALKIPMDVRNEQSVKQAAALFANKYDHLDLLVNNAGLGVGRVSTGSEMGEMPFYEIEVDAFRDVIETNLTGYFTVTKYFIPMMLRCGKGRIVNVSTSEPTKSMPGQIPYGPSRAGSDSLTLTIANELKDKGITVNILQPGGPVDTGLIPEHMREYFVTKLNLLKSTVLNDAILFLASDKALGITGQNIVGSKLDEWLIDNNITI